MVKRRIILCSESLRVPTGPTKPDQQYSVDAQAIIELLKNNFPALKEDLVETEPRGFKGKDDFMKKVPILVKNTFETFRHRRHEFEIFVIALRDTDTSDGKKISAIRRKLADKIKKLIRVRKAIYSPSVARFAAAASRCGVAALQAFQRILRLCADDC
jgi:hypothetical protein